MKKLLTKFVFALAAGLASLAMAAHVFGSAGELDPTFGNNGISIFDTQGETADYGWFSRMLPDGKILTLGPTFGGGKAYALARLLPDGALDSSFGTNGKVVTIVGSAITLQQDGKIVLAGKGNCSGSNCDFAVLRLNADGSKDTAFGNNGIAYTSIRADAYALAVVVQADGKIVLAGSAGNFEPFLPEKGSLNLRLKTENPDNRRIASHDIPRATRSAFLYDFTLVRYNSDGSIDSTFGNSGIVQTKLTKTSEIRALLIQPDQKLVAIGIDSDNGDFVNVALARYKTNGSLDGSFGTNGIVITDIDGRNDFGDDAVLQADGKITVSGGSVDGTDSEILVLQYFSNGQPDSAFGTAGRVITRLPGDVQEGTTIQRDPGGRLYVSADRTEDFTVLAYLSNGQLDPAFNGGVVNIDLQTISEDSFGVTLQTDDKIILTGSTGDNASAEKLTLLRLLPNGFPDSSFSDDGISTVDFTNSNGEFLRKIKVLDDGKILAAGTLSRFTAPNAHLLARYDANGAIDTTFGSNGYVFTQTSDFTELDDLEVQADGKIVISGRIDLEVEPIQLVRYLEDGALDPTFGTNGTVNIPFHNRILSTDIAIQPDGKIVVAATLQIFEGENFYDLLLLRCNPDGSLDTTFGSDGIVVVDFDGGESAADVVLQSDGKIILLSSFYAARFNSDGSLDLSYGSAGVSIIDSFGATTALLQPDGSLLIGGSAQHAQSFNSDFGIVRLLPNGSLDPGFGTNGLVVLDLGEDSDQIVEMALLADGRIVAAGTENFLNTDKLFLAAFKNDGSVDTTFGLGGKVIAGFASAVSAAVDAAGRIVVGGIHFTPETFADFALARYATEPPNTALLFFDDFEDSVLSWVVKSSGWQESNGNLTGDKGTAMAPAPWTPSGNSSCTVCTFQVGVRIVNDPVLRGKLTFIGWNQSANNQVQLTIKPGASKIMFRQKTGAGAGIKKTVNLQFSEVETHRVEMSFDGTDFHVLIDSVEILRMKAAATPSGNFGLGLKKMLVNFSDALIF